MSLLFSCSKKITLLDSIIGCEPVAKIYKEKGIDYIQYKIYPRSKDLGFIDVIDKLEKSPLFEGFNRADYGFAIEIDRDPNCMIYNQVERKRVSYNNFSSKKRYVIVEYQEYIIFCFIKV